MSHWKLCFSWHRARHISFVNCTHKHLVSEVSVPDLHIHLARKEKTCRGCEVNCEVKTILRLQSVAKEKKGWTHPQFARCHRNPHRYGLCFLLLFMWSVTTNPFRCRHNSLIYDEYQTLFIKGIGPDVMRMVQPYNSLLWYPQHLCDFQFVLTFLWHRAFPCLS